jgi:elongation factor P
MILASDLDAGIASVSKGKSTKSSMSNRRRLRPRWAGFAKTKLINVRSGRMWEPHFHPQEKLEDLELERRTMEFLFADGESCTFMRADTFEQIEVPAAIVGNGRVFLQSGMQVPIEFSGGEPISVVFPNVAEARVVKTALPSHSQQDRKEAVLEEGLSIRVPLFIAPGERVGVDVKTGRYMDRARAHRRRIA